MLQDSIYRVPGVVKLLETECRTVVARGWGQGGMGLYCLMGTEFQIRKIKSSTDG